MRLVLAMLVLLAGCSRGPDADALKRDVEVTFHTDASHLAGLQIHLGNTVVDSTVRGRLRAMQSLLTKE